MSWPRRCGLVSAEVLLKRPEVRACMMDQIHILKAGKPCSLTAKLAWTLHLGCDNVVEPKCLAALLQIEA